MTVTSKISDCIEKGSLVSLTVNLRQRKNVTCMCRLLKYDSGEGIIVVYDVDLKQVQTYMLNEIDELS